MKKTLVLAVCGVATVSQIQADTIADWTFETSIPSTAGPFSPEIGAGSASGLHAGAAVYSSPSGNGSPHSFSANTWAVGDYYQVRVSTVGFQNVMLSFDETSSNTGPGKYQLQYSTDGTTFTPFGADYTVLANATPNPLWNNATSNPASTYTDSFGSLLDNATTVYLRFVDDGTVSANGGAIGTGGTDRMDNIIITASAVPEPTTLSLIGLGGLASLFFMARRKK